MWPFGKPPSPAPVVAVPERREPPVITELVVQRARALKKATPAPSPFVPAKPFPGVMPKGVEFAADDALQGQMSWAGNLSYGLIHEGVVWPGYAYLSELALRPEYRRVSEVLARHMTRKWVKIISTGDEDKSDRIAAIEAAWRRMRLQQVVRRAVEHDGLFGRGHIFLDFGTNDGPELATSIGDGWNDASRAKIAKGSFKAARNVEPVWTYPADYNSTNPLDADWYSPRAWNTMGNRVDSSRLLTLVGREVPDLLKSAYAFGGMSVSQMIKPYVDNFLRNRDGATDILNSFCQFVLKTDVVNGMAGQGDNMFRRAEVFAEFRDNRNLVMVDKETEDFANVSAPLGTIDSLLAKSQEFICSIASIPVVELLGIQPAGLNASSEGEIQTFEGTIHAAQEAHVRPLLHPILGYTMLSEFGEIDEDITFDFEPLRQMSERDRADLHKVQAETDAVYVDMGALSVEEVRGNLASDEGSPYQNINVDALPEPPAPAEAAPAPKLEVP